MPYSLLFDGVDDSVNLNSDLDFTGDFDITFIVKFSLSRNDGLLYNRNSTNNFFGKLNNNSFFCRLGGQTITYSSVFDETAEHELRWVRVGSLLSCYFDGDLKNSSSSFTGGAVLNTFGKFQGGNNFLGEMKRVFGSAGVANFDYNKQSLSGANDTTWDETVGGNNGTLTNFPTDNSQWIFYSDSTGVTADVAYTVNSPSVSASASATVPAPQAGIAFSVSPPSVSVSASTTLPQSSSDIAFTVNAPSVAANASATLPGYNATVSFTVSAPSVSADASATLPNPSADVIYTVSTPVVSASASATLPNPVSDIAFTVSAPSVSVSAAATEPNFNGNVAFTVNAPSVSISASATLPQPESTVSFAVSPPSVSVVAIVGGIAIIVDEETNINQRVLSNNINAPILSNNING